jgi:hypothetical protein
MPQELPTAVAKTRYRFETARSTFGLPFLAHFTSVSDAVMALVTLKVPRKPGVQSTALPTRQVSEFS